MVMTHGLIEINFAGAQLEEGAFSPNEQQSTVLSLVLDELEQLDGALRPLRG